MLTISTKLFRPQLARGLVERSRLLDQLNQGLDQRRLTIVSAPPGYGKTTLVAQWLATLDGPTTWLSLDKLDNDLGTFAEYLTAAVRAAYPDCCHLASALLAAPQPTSPAVMADALIEDLANLPESLVIALDDFHVIDAPAVHECLQRIVQYLPTNCQIAIASRETLPWPLGRLRASGELTEVGQEDLRFTIDEVQRFLGAMLKKPVSQAAVESIVRYAEGWVVGLQLAALGQRDRGENADFGPDSWANQSHVTEYLVDEVLARQMDATRDFLLRTSILDRFCDPLVRAMLDTPPAGEALTPESGPPTIGRLMRANLFLTPLDREHVWYRYHHLFQGFLQRRLLEIISPDELRALHRRAGDWFERQGLIEEAINHTVAAGDEEHAIHIAVSHAHEAFNREQWQRVAHWLALLPEPARHHPAALVIRGWVHMIQSRLRALGLVAKEAETRLAVADKQLTTAERDHLQPQIDMHKAVVAYWAGDPETTLSLTQRSLAGLGPDMLYARSIGQYYYATSLNVIRGTAEALAYTQEALEAQFEPSDTITARLILAQMLIYLDSGNMRQFQRSAELLGRVGERSGLMTSITWMNTALGLAAYEANDLPLAETYLRRVTDAPHYGNGRAAYESFITLALTLEAMGERAAADDTLNKLREFLLEADNATALVLVEAAQLLLTVVRGEQLPALRPIEPSEAMARVDLRSSFLVSPLRARARCRIAAGQAGDLEEAAAILDVSRRAAESLHDIPKLIEILALEASLNVARGDEPAALDALDQSLRLAEPGRLIRAFVDCGPSLVPLLERLRQDFPAPRYVERVLGAFASTTATAGMAPTRPSVTPYLHLRASLTNREMEVLLLLADRLSNKEIAARLVVAPETVRRYTARIFQKLGVNNRRAAVSMAAHLGLIPA